MPTLLSCRDIKISFADLYKRSPITRPKDPLERYPGAHQSDILTYCAVIAKYLKPGEKLEEDMPERMLMGLMFEEFFFSLLLAIVELEMAWQPGEKVEDEIACNCDGIGWLKETFVLEKPKDGKLKWLIAEYAIWETKCTEKKARTAEEFLQEFVYMQQGRSYCKTYGCNVVRWIIWFYRGNYDGKGPVCREYTVHFSDKEIEDTWTMMKKNKDDAMEYKKQMEAKGTAA